MLFSDIKKILLLFIFIVSLTSCSTVFENNYDVMARQALFDLMKAQETYREKNNKYTKELSKLIDQGLKYHNGIVYLEIHTASKDEYRAISLPAESSTARVFVYDTSEGGYYEADEVEVSKYVLGALNFIRSEKEKQKTNIFLASILLVSLVFLGFRFVFKYKEEGNNIALTSYFISLPALVWAVAIINNINKDIVLSSKIIILSSIALVISLLCIFTSLRWLKNRNPLTTPTPILGLTGCTLFISLISLGSVAYILARYYPV